MGPKFQLTPVRSDLAVQESCAWARRRNKVTAFPQWKQIFLRVVCETFLECVRSLFIICCFSSEIVVHLVDLSLWVYMFICASLRWLSRASRLLERILYYTMFSMHLCVTGYGDQLCRSMLTLICGCLLHFWIMQSRTLPCRGSVKFPSCRKIPLWLFSVSKQC